MDKMTIKVTLNSNNPAEEELIKILKNVRNKSAYLKMASFHYCNILNKLSHATSSSKQENPELPDAGVDKSDNNPESGLKKANKNIDISFIGAFDNIS